MATKKQHIIDNYPLLVYNYKVIIGGSETMSFSDVSGLEIGYEHVLYRHGFSWVTGGQLIRGQRKSITITLKRGLVTKREYLYEWLKTADQRNFRIELCDETGVAAVSWEVSKALPLKLDAPSFSANTNDVAIESLELIAHDLKITYNK